MKQIFKLSLLLLALLQAATAFAHDFEVDGIYYNIINSNEAEVTYQGTYDSQYSNEYSGSVTIPATVTYGGTTYSVTAIGEYAFRGCSSLTSIDIPNSVTTIDMWAFSYCTGLTSVNFGNSVTSIGYCAFNGCSGLTRVTIPNSVTNIGEMAFTGCSGLTSLTIPNSVTSIGEIAFHARRQRQVLTHQQGCRHRYRLQVLTEQQQHIIRIARQKSAWRFYFAG